MTAPSTITLRDSAVRSIIPSRQTFGKQREPRCPRGGIASSEVASTSLRAAGGPASSGPAPVPGDQYAPAGTAAAGGQRALLSRIMPGDLRSPGLPVSVDAGKPAHPGLR